MYDFRLGCLRAALVGLSAVSCIPRIVLGQEVAPYRMTGVEGNITLRYLGDEQTSSGNGVVQPHEKRATFQEELNIFTHGYVYHPNFLKVDVGGGPMQVQNRLDTNAGSNRSDDTDTNEPRIHRGQHECEACAARFARCHILRTALSLRHRLTVTLAKAHRLQKDHLPCSFEEARV